MPEQPSIALLCTHFPPHNGTGARRPYYLARHLADRGHRVTVLTTDAHKDPAWNPDLQGLRIVRFETSGVLTHGAWPKRWLSALAKRAEGSYIGRALRLLADLWLPLNLRARWDQPMAEIAERVGPHDIVVATGPAWDMLEIGRELAYRWKAAFVPDYRDNWNAVIEGVGVHCLNHQGRGLAGRLRRTRNLEAEREALTAAHGLTAATQGCLDNALAVGGERPALVVYNGVLQQPRAEHARNERCTVLYSGRVYQEQDWSMVSQALARVREARPDSITRLELRIRGGAYDSLETRARMEAMGRETGMIRFLPECPRDEAACEGARADLLLTLVLEGNTGALTLKLIDYLSYRRPIIIVGRTKGLQHEVLERTRAGRAATNAEELAALVVEAFDTWSAGDPLRHIPDEGELNELSMAAQMERWRDFLLAMMGHGKERA